MSLGHELTHVLLADLFPNQTLPRWLDEGIAILADMWPVVAKDHLTELKTALVCDPD